MAGAGGTTPPTPLRLKDLLELDCDSCSAAGFRCYPRRLGESAAPVRRLLESSHSLRRRPSKLSHLSRSLSRRLSRRGGFWRRRDEDEDEDDAAATAAATAVAPGCGSSCSEELETSSSESSDNSSGGRTSRRSRSDSDSDDFSSATEDASVHHHPSQAAAAAGDEQEVVAMKTVSKEGSSSGSEADDKEQLSPVAVMDFPFDDDDEYDQMTDAGVACSPSFSLARLQRRKTHKIRRLGSHDELAPMDLEALLAATSDSDDSPPAADVPAQAQQMIQCRTECAATPTCASSGHRGAGVHDVPDEDDLVSLLTGTVSAGLDDVSERLLLDFFVEMMKRRRRSDAHAESELPLTAPAAGVLRRKAERVVDDGEAVAAAARGWLEGTGGTERRWGLTDVLSGGAAIVAEMERGRRWMQVGEEEREVGALVAGMLVDELVGEVVWCLFV